MKNYKKIELQRKIVEIENPYPKDDLILSYFDFLKVREYIAYYQFNPLVFHHLLNLANDEWKTEKRISRLSLLLKVKQYYHLTQQENKVGFNSRSTKPNFEVSKEIRIQMFNLFKKTYEESKYISIKQIDEARKICNNLLINLELTEIEEEWFCANVSLSEQILNRVLRYPQKSDVISNWAKMNFNNNKLRHRRAELISWIIDIEPDFEIDQKTLIDDFEYLNQMDIKAIQDYDDEIEAIRFIENQLGDSLPKTLSIELFDETFKEKKNYEFSQPTLELFRRPYIVEIDNSKHYPVRIPNFDKMKQGFYSKIAIHQPITMIWGIAYSRLNNYEKSTLLKKYYSDKTYYSILRV
jgi:hypothetical protein